MVLAPPPLATASRLRFRFPGLIRWWHLLSLDAPTVAALWSWSVARAVHIRLPWTAPLLLALGTWLVYVADRLLDGVRIAADGQLRERHLLYARHRGKLLAAALVVGLALLWLVTTHMSPAARREDTALFGAALIYFLVIHLGGSLSKFGIERWFPKEIAVAVVFAAAVAVPAWSRLPGSRTSLIPLVATFSSLCWLNCVAIEKWERTPPGVARTSSAAQPHASTRWALRHVGLVACSLALLAVIGCVQSTRIGDHVAMSALYLACALSAMLFPLLDLSRLNSLELRIAADAALLTPLLFFMALR